MTSRARDAERLPIGTVIWTCQSNFILCPDDHLYTYHEQGMLRDMRRLEGHDFFKCTMCKPASHFFVVFSTSPDPHATCYLISPDCWKEWATDPSATTLSTPEMLHRLRDPAGRSYNPYFRPRI